MKVIESQVERITHSEVPIAELAELKAIRDSVKRRREEQPIETPAWRQPEVEKVFQNWMQDHFGQIDLELLCTAMFNAGGRNAIFNMTQFSGINADIARIESRVVGLHALLESLTTEDR